MSIGFLIGEFLKVNIAFFFTMFLWPKVVFARHLRGKSRTYTFAFCSVFMVLLIHQVTIFLGLLHILNVWIMRLLFWGVFAYYLVQLLSGQTSFLKGIHNFFNSTMGIKTLVLNIGTGIKSTFQNVIFSIKRLTKQQLMLFVLLGIACVYGVLYFTYGGFSYFSFGASDGNVHVSWIYQLAQGQIFASGIYPEGMHCLIYAMSELYPVELYSCMIFAPAGAVALLIISIYIFLRELFYSKYTPILAIIGFLCVGTTNILSISRLQWTLPQEYIFYAMFLCAAFFIRYCHSSQTSVYLPVLVIRIKNVFRKKQNRQEIPETITPTKYYWDENIFIFMLSIATTLCSHFYTTFMSVFLCIGLIPMLLVRICHVKRFVPLFATALGGGILAFILMFAAYGEGYQLENSLYYGLNVMGVPTASHPSVREQTIDIVWSRLPQTIYQKGLVENYGEPLAKVIVAAGIIALVAWIFYVFVSGVICLVEKKDHKVIHYLDGYVSLVLCACTFYAFAEGRMWGFWELMEANRTYAIAHILFMAVLVIPLDLLLSAVSNFKSTIPAQVMATVLVAAQVSLIVMSGHYHGFLYWNFSRYNGAVEVTESIVGKLPADTFTLISTTDEIYQFVDYGWHEELIDFVNNSARENGKSYTIPTEYVFIMYEKKPLLRGQIHYLEGPAWFANNSYYEYTWPNGMIGDNYSYMMAEDKFILEGNPNLETSLQNYANVVIRAQLMATCKVWLERFESLYPNALHKYYEDDEIACYYFSQNTDALYELAIR